MEVFSKINKAGLKQNYLTSVRKYKQFSQRPSSKVSGLVSLTVFMVAFFSLFAILPTFKTIGALRKEVEDIELINQKLTRKIQALNKAEEVYGQQANNLQLISLVLPERAEFERLAWQIEWLALDKGVRLDSGSYNEFPLIDDEMIEELQSIEIELTVSGDYLRIKEFVKALSKIDRLIAISSINISNKKLKQGAGTISTSIKLSASYLPYAN